jgi:hypothetical protein
MLINFLAFQLGWFCAIYFHSGWAALLCILLAVFNFYLSSKVFVRTLVLGLVIATIGFLNDYLLIKFAIIQLPTGDYFPWWLYALWILFLSTFGGFLAGFKHFNIFILSMLGAAGGSISYCVAAKLGAFTYNITYIPEFAFHAINWLVLFPILFLLFQRLNSTICK